MGRPLLAPRLTRLNDSFGDGDFKPFGVTAEPEIKHRVMNGMFRPIDPTVSP
jgi:hypothetical protein